jgi:hypothetical protein
MFWKTIFIFAICMTLSCGVETLLVILPAISATWCDSNDPCHKFEFRPGQNASDTRERGNIGGAEYFLSGGLKYKFGDLSAEGENFIIGTFNGLNVEFDVHYRLQSNFEEKYVGSVDPEAAGGKQMHIKNLTTGQTFILNTAPCNCQ